MINESIIQAYEKVKKADPEKWYEGRLRKYWIPLFELYNTVKGANLKPGCNCCCKSVFNYIGQQIRANANP